MDKENKSLKITPTGNAKATAAALKKITNMTEPQKFTLEKLKKHSKELFGIDKCTFEGAVYGKSGEYTVDEMKEIINKWKAAKPKEEK